MLSEERGVPLAHRCRCAWWWRHCDRAGQYSDKPVWRSAPGPLPTPIPHPSPGSQALVRTLRTAHSLSLGARFPSSSGLAARVGLPHEKALEGAEVEISGGRELYGHGEKPAPREQGGSGGARGARAGAGQGLSARAARVPRSPQAPPAGLRCPPLHPYADAPRSLAQRGGSQSQARAAAVFL